jgi:ubiquinone/menaquinone biosynthesis C-methylase UbiE
VVEIVDDAHESWESSGYAAAWAAEDVMAPVLELPRELSKALVIDAGIEVRHVIDLGSGPGSYLRTMLEAFPEAAGTWVDGSAAMLELARRELSHLGARVTFIVAELERLDSAPLEPADVVVSSRALHHLAPVALASVYRTVAGVLRPRGFMLNLDHVGSPDDYWHGTYRRIRDELVGSRRTQLKPHRQDGPLPTAELHLNLMSDAGLVYADVPWRFLTTALLVARKPE